MVAALFSAVAQGAASEGTTLNLSFDKAVDMAIERNRTLQNASLDVKKAEAAKWEAVASMLPQVSGSLAYSSNFNYGMEMMGQTITMPASGQLAITASVALSAAQIISTQIGKISVDMANVSKEQTNQDIANQVRILYYSALVAGETQDLLTKNLENLKKLYEFSQNAVNVGAAEQVDADQIMVQVANMETTLSTSKRSMEMVYNSMRLLMNIDVDTEIVLSQTIDELLSVPHAKSLIAEDLVLENNYSYQLVSQSAKLSKMQVNMAGWAYAPTLSAYYQYTGKKNFGEARFNMTIPHAMGITLSVPIWSSGQRYKALQGAKLAHEKQLNTLADTEMALKVQHRQLKYNLTSAIERLETQTKNVEVNQRVFDNISLKYEHGYSSSMDVTTAGTNLISAQSSYVQALLEFVNAQIELEKLLNK
jgi:outer membrane protein TolC